MLLRLFPCAPLAGRKHRVSAMMVTVSTATTALAPNSSTGFLCLLKKQNPETKNRTQKTKFLKKKIPEILLALEKKEEEKHKNPQNQPDKTYKEQQKQQKSYTNPTILH